MNNRRSIWFVGCLGAALFCCAPVHLAAQFVPPSWNRKPVVKQAMDKEIAAQFAPIIYQGLGDQPRFDYITNFDFDGDWKGDNNWANAESVSYPLRAFVYYSVSETATHYFVHYAFFHPRDYKGGLANSTLVEVLIAEGIRRAGTDPTGIANDVALSHENDLEGCLVVAQKRGNGLSEAEVQYVETLAHNRFLQYRPGRVYRNNDQTIELDGQRALLFVEPKGHGVERYTGRREQLRQAVKGTLVYSFMGTADDPDQRRGDSVSYDLIPIQETLWAQAQKGDNETYGEVNDYAKLTVLQRLGGKDFSTERELGKLGSAFRGTVGFKNKARPPWGWFDSTEKDRPLGEWFFNPAAVIARHFYLDSTFAQAYIYHPYLDIGLAERMR